jgi:photosystem II stability/assembly factor-like uncharacterized protein
MSIPTSDVIWVSGSNGHVGRSTDKGKTWRWGIVPGYEKRDFRDIHAFDSATAIIMGIDNPAYILKTKDGGKTWKLVFTKEAPGMFLDAMDFLNGKEGICIGDPMEAGSGRKRFFILRTKDGGDTWREAPTVRSPLAEQGEAVFSASGTNIALLRSKDYDYAFISGGLASNLYMVGKVAESNKMCPLKMAKGTESSGAFSMATDRNKAFYCIGGDYKNPKAATDAFVWTTDGGKNWKTPVQSPPFGYRSCIRIIEGGKLVACGSNGVDMCNNPADWKHISDEGFNVCMVSPDKKLAFFGGSKGRIGLLRL